MVFKSLASESLLYDLVTMRHYAACVKDISNGAFLICNQPLVDTFGLAIFKKPKDLIGSDLNQVNAFMRHHWGKGYIEKIAKMDYQLKTSRGIFVERGEIYINGLNQVRIRDILKMPLFGISRKITAALTIMPDRTRELDMFHLFNLYTKMHKDLQSSIKNFMQHIGISQFFSENLTYKETSCLLNMQINPAYKAVAKELNISVKTVEIHISHIISKLKNPYFQLSNILSHMRRN